MLAKRVSLTRDLKFYSKNMENTQMEREERVRGNLKSSRNSGSPLRISRSTQRGANPTIVHRLKIMQKPL
uniref:Uncharacterized protein n=1 Tax=Phlebotomus papatasi TaxID=29031 RepID=A0A1B0CZH6_PHLPP